MKAAAALVAGYVALAVVAGATNSPLTVLLPSGAHPPAWASSVARDAGLDGVGRQGLTAIAWALLVAVMLAYAFVLVGAWRGRLAVGPVLVASGVALAVSVAAPLLLSRDVYTYAAYGRIAALDHADPYVATLSMFPHDAFAAASSEQWQHTHSHYGPLFTLLGAGIARLWPTAVGTTILVYKLLAGLAIAAATGLVTLTATHVRPERAAFAAAVVGLDPVIVLHTVGGAHVQALVALLLAAALFVATRPGRASSVTVLLTLACLVEGILVPVLALWLWRNRGRPVIRHLVVVAALTAASLAPFGVQALRPVANLGGIEAWASPSHLVGRAAQLVAGHGAGEVVHVAFLVLFAALAVRIARRRLPVADAWGTTLLLLALSLPFLLPWQAAWFTPFVGLLADTVVVACGTLAAGVLALTLVPADPFHGFTSPAVLDGVHYGAAPVLLALFAVVAART